MNKALLAILTISLVGALTGCNTLPRQPHVQEAMISPEILNPGDSATITVRIKDRYDIVDSVTGVVVEDPRLKFRLRDDGEPPDVKAGDDIWSLLADVPFLAPPGDFTLQFTALKESGAVVMVRTESGVEPLQAIIPVQIEYPVDVEAPAEGMPE